MLPGEVERRFRQRLAAFREDWWRLGPERLLDELLGAYREERVEGCDPEAEEDLLLFQCGRFDWGDGEEFELDLVRQLTFRDARGEYDHLGQLHVTLFYPVEIAGDAELEFSLWSSECASLEQFAERVRSTAGFALACRHAPRRGELLQEEI